jgi:hypothetical protein
MLLDDLLQASRAGKIELDPFTYSAQFPITTFIGGATVPINISINADSDFVIRYTNLAAWSAAGVPVVTPDYTLIFFDTGSGRNLQDQAIHVATVTGTGQLPFIWPEPKLIKGNSTLVVTLTNLTAIPALAYVTLSGFKVFYLANYNRSQVTNIV